MYLLVTLKEYWNLYMSDSVKKMWLLCLAVPKKEVWPLCLLILGGKPYVHISPTEGGIAFVPVRFSPTEGGVTLEGAFYTLFSEYATLTNASLLSVIVCCSTVCHGYRYNSALSCNTAL